MNASTPDNCLYFGDNLDILREHIGSESVDLIYLDPPFNSARDYNILFASPRGKQSEAQIVAFKDSWQWGMQAEREYDDIIHGGNTHVAEMIQAMRRFLGENDMMAYLVMMARRLIELHRVLKPTGSLYLHCDPVASHYLKIVLDTIFSGNFRNEITWKRTAAHGNAKRFGPVHDILLFYSKTERYLWNFPKVRHSGDYVQEHFKQRDEDGRMFQSITLTGPGVTQHGDSGKAWRHVNPTDVKRHWAIPGHVIERYHLTGETPQERLDALDAAGLIFWPKSEDGTPRLKWYADELEGMAIPDVWTDIHPISAKSAERLGYPTQKPLALLERIIHASSREGDVILDPFCGCGTAVHAAQKLNRKWIGVDITHLAIALIEKRLKDAFPGVEYEAHGTPRDMEGARDLAARDKYQFQWWACSLVNAQPYQGKKKGADGGIDGLIYFQDEPKTHKKIVVSVKGGGNVSVAMVRDLVGVLEREQADIGLFVTLAPPTQPMRTEAAKAGFYKSPTLDGEFPRLQILTIDGLLEGRERPCYPDLARGGLTFKKARREEKATDQKPLF